MTGYELKIWRISMGWEQERAAEELGVARRTYQSYEQKSKIPKSISLATQSLSLTKIYSTLENMNKPQILYFIKAYLNT